MQVLATSMSSLSAQATSCSVSSPPGALDTGHADAPHQGSPEGPWNHSFRFEQYVLPARAASECLIV